MTFELPDYSKFRQDSIDNQKSPLGKDKMSQALQGDQDYDKKLLETNVFENFFQQNSDQSKKKVLLVISGSHIDEEDRSQSYPNYLKTIAKSNPDCDFLVLNIDPNFTTNLNPEGDIADNVNLKFLRGYLSPAKNPQFYSEIGNNLQNFDKVILCSHTHELGALDSHTLHKHCQKNEIDCITIGAYFNDKPCFVINKPNLIEDDFVPLALFNKIYWFVDSDFLKELSDQDQLKATSVVDFFSTQTPPNLDSVMTYSGIEDPVFKNSVSEFVVESGKNSSRLENQTLLTALSSINLSQEASAGKEGIKK